jgi:hypothetical protein
VRVHTHPSERGSAAIEFALSVIILAVLIFGCIGVTMAFYTYEVINEYARDASRYAIVHGNGCTKPDSSSCSIGTGGGTGSPASMALKTYLNHEIFPGINGNNLEVTTTYGPGPGGIACAVICNGSGDQVTVTVSYPYLYNIPFIPPRSFTMHGSSTMIISQ